MQGASLPSAFALNPAAALRGQALRQASGSLSTGPTMVPLLDLQTTASQSLPTGTVPTIHPPPAATQHNTASSQLPAARQPSTSLQNATDRLVSLFVCDPRFTQAVQASNTSQAAAAAIEVMKAHLTQFINTLSRQLPATGTVTHPAGPPSIPTMVPQTLGPPLASAASSMLESASPTKRALDADAPARSQGRRDAGTRRGEVGRELKPGELVKITHGNKRTADHIVGQFAKVVSVETNGWVNCQLVSSGELVRLQQRYLSTATPPLPLPAMTALATPIITSPPTSVPPVPAPLTTMPPMVPVPIQGPTAVAPAGPNQAVVPGLPSGMIPTALVSAAGTVVPPDAASGALMPAVSSVPVAVQLPKATGEAVDASGLIASQLAARVVSKTRELVRGVRKEVLSFEEDIPWNAVDEPKWRAGRNAWRRAVRSADSVAELAVKLGELHDNLRTEKTHGLFLNDGTWHRSLKDCIQGRAHFQTFQSVWSEWRSAVQEWLRARALNLPPPADALSQANASRAAAALDIAALFGTDYVEQVPLESILNHHRESFGVLKNMVERERAKVAAKIEAMNSDVTSDGTAVFLDPQLASSLLSTLHDNTAMKGTTGLTHVKSFQSDMDTDMDDGSDATDLNDSDME